jgi:hypothetical protein
VSLEVEVCSVLNVLPSLLVSALAKFEEIRSRVTMKNLNKLFIANIYFRKKI